MRQEKGEGMWARVPEWKGRGIAAAPLGWTSSVEEETWITQETEQSVWGGEQARDPALGQSGAVLPLSQEGKQIRGQNAGRAVLGGGNNGVMPFAFRRLLGLAEGGGGASSGVPGGGVPVLVV